MDDKGKLSASTFKWNLLPQQHTGFESAFSKKMPWSKVCFFECSFPLFMTCINLTAHFSTSVCVSTFRNAYVYKHSYWPESFTYWHIFLAEIAGNNQKCLFYDLTESNYCVTYDLHPSNVHWSRLIQLDTILKEDSLRCVPISIY